LRPVLHAMNHQLYMRRCFDLALNGSGFVAPNPLVGSVLVHDGRIVSEGWHAHYGGPHAEVHAISNLADRSLLPGCTLYVNLEPCNHFGKTPPCTDLILSSGIRKVVIANTDPNPLVSGKGIQKLKAAGIEVTAGILIEDGRNLNKRFFTFHEKQRPFIILKWAESADRLIAPLPENGKKGVTWLSNTLSRKLTHIWRSEESSILVGSNTVMNDNPRLTVRGFKAKNPVRIVIDPDLNCDPGSHVFAGKEKVIVFNHLKNDQIRNVSYVSVPRRGSMIKYAMNRLFENGIQSVFVEGGSFTIQSFIEENLWDEARVFRTPVMLNDGISAPVLESAPNQTFSVLTDQLDFYINPQ